MNLNPFAKFEVTIETDEATPGTPFRVCHLRVSGRRCDSNCVRKVRAALQMLDPACEVQQLPMPDGREASKLGALFRMGYYGAQVPPEKIKQAVERAL